MSEIFPLEILAKSIRTVDLLSKDLRRTLTGDVLVLLALLAKDFERGEAVLLSAQDSSALRVFDELKKMNHESLPPFSLGTKCVLIDLTEPGIIADKPGFSDVIESAELLVTFGLSQRGKAFLEQLSSTSTLSVVGFPSCRFLSTSGSTSLWGLSMLQSGPTLGTIVSAVTASVRSAGEQALMNELRLRAAQDASEKIQQLRLRIVQLTLESSGLRDSAIGSEATVGTLQWKLDRLNEHLNHLDNELKIARDTNDAILKSRTFRLGRMMTAPLRAARRIVRKLR